MIDIKRIRENPSEIKKMIVNRNMEYDIDYFLKIDEERRILVNETQQRKRSRNLMANEISSLKKENQDNSTKISEMKILSDKINQTDEKIRKLDNEVDELLSKLPNIIHNSVPLGKDETDNKNISSWGDIKKSKYSDDHINLGKELDLIDINRAGKVAGSRFYYLKGNLVRLKHALMSYSLDFIQEKGFNIIQPPYALRKEALNGSIIFSDFEEVIYKIENEDLYLIATSEHAIAAMHMNEVFQKDVIPLKYSGISPCFRKEAGAHGKDTKGIFRVHQFEKIEQFIFSEPDDSWNQLENIVSNTQEIFRNLELPHRVILLCTGDLGKISAKTYDIELWFPSHKKYREAASCSNCTDYQSRGLSIKYRNKPHEESKFIHTLNGTLIAVERTLIAIMENYQLENGEIEIPKVLQKYMGNTKIIRK